jgi:hypothetical protein
MSAMETPASKRSKTCADAATTTPPKCDGKVSGAANSSTGTGSSDTQHQKCQLYNSDGKACTGSGSTSGGNDGTSGGNSDGAACTGSGGTSGGNGGDDINHWRWRFRQSKSNATISSQATLQSALLAPCSVSYESIASDDMNMLANSMNTMGLGHGLGSGSLPVSEGVAAAGAADDEAAEAVPPPPPAPSTPPSSGAPAARPADLLMICDGDVNSETDMEQPDDPPISEGESDSEDINTVVTNYLDILNLISPLCAHNNASFNGTNQHWVKLHCWACGNVLKVRRRLSIFDR